MGLPWKNVELAESQTQISDSLPTGSRLNKFKLVTKRSCSVIAKPKRAIMSTRKLATPVARGHSRRRERPPLTAWLLAGAWLGAVVLLVALAPYTSAPVHATLRPGDALLIAPSPLLHAGARLSGVGWRAERLVAPPPTHRVERANRTVLALDAGTTSIVVRLAAPGSGAV